MTTALQLNNPDSKGQIAQYKAVSDRLYEAVQAHGKAKTLYDNARDFYDDRKHDLIARGQGLGGRASNDEKEAHLANLLKVEIHSLRTARDILRAAEAELEAARVLERAERATLQALQNEFEYGRPLR